MIIATDGSDNPGESSPWAPFYSASGQPALPIGDSPVFATRLPEEEAGNASSLWVHFSAIPLPPDHGLPLGFVASPLAMTSARAFITELEAWSHLKTIVGTGWTIRSSTRASPPKPGTRGTKNAMKNVN